MREVVGGDGLVGIRHQVHDEPDPEWLKRPDVRRGISAVGDPGLPVDLLVRPRELPAALDTVRSLPAVRFVIDHLAKPPIRSGDIEPWASLIRPFGGEANVWCKLSGLVTEADWDDVDGGRSRAFRRRGDRDVRSPSTPLRLRLARLPAGGIVRRRLGRGRGGGVGPDSRRNRGSVRRERDRGLRTLTAPRWLRMLG